MTTRENYNANVQGNGHRVKEPNNTIHRSECVISRDSFKSNTRPPIPTIKEIVRIPKSNIKPSIPTVKETIPINKQDKPISIIKPHEVNEIKGNKLHKEQKPLTNSKVPEKKRLDVIKKKKLAEERKKRLDELEKTTRELAKASVNQKNIPIPNESKTDRNIPTKSTMPEINMTWSPPPPLPRVKKLNKTLKTPLNLKKKLINDECLNATKNNKTISPKNTKTPSKLINKRPPIHKVTKPEDLFSKLNSVIDSNVLLIDLLSTKSLNSDTSLMLQDHDDVSMINENYQINDSKQQGRGDFTILNKKRSSDINLNTKLIDNLVINLETFEDLKLPDKFEKEIGHNNTEQQEDDITLNRKTSFDIDSCTKLSDNINIDSEKHLDLKFPKRDNKEIMQSIDHSAKLQELLIDQCLFNNKFNSESTQTDESNDLLSLFSFFPKRSPPPMNFISVLKYKNRLQQLEKDNLESYKPVTSLNKKEFTISNNVNVDKIYNTNNTKSTGTNRQNVIDNDNTIYLENSNQNKQENNLHNCTSSFIDETIKSDHNIDLYLNCIIEDNMSKEKLNTVNNDKPFSNIKTNEDVKQVLKKLNCDFDSLTKNHCYNTGDLHIDCESLKSGENNLSDKSFSRFSEIRDEFKAELNILDQLNDSLCDIEKMSCDTSLTNNDQSIDAFNNYGTFNDLNLETRFDDSSLNNNKPMQFSKLNDLSSNMMSVDKTITGFSIQMFEQLIKDEELRAKQHFTILNLREKSITNRLKWEITMCDLQTRNLKYRPGNEKQLQLLKQKHRGTVKKLEQSLAQVKQLRRVIDSVYKQRLIMLEEHLQHLKIQSSSKKVIRRLKSLDQIPKKEENIRHLVNPNFYKQSNETDSVDTIENGLVNKNSAVFHITSSPSKSQIALRNQATSPINIEKNIFKHVENVEVQTDIDLSLQPSIHKPVQTSITLLTCSNDENLKSFDPNNENESSGVNKTKDIRTISSISPPITSPAKLRKLSETSISTNSEQSDMDVRITKLQEQLEVRKSEFLKIRNEQKKLKSENLRAKEQELLKLIELYDSKIEKSKKNLMAEVEKKKVQLIKSKLNQNITNNESDHPSEKHDPHFHSSRTLLTDGKNCFHPIVTNKSTSNEIISLKPVNKLQQTSSIIPNENINTHTIDSNVREKVFNKLRKQLGQSSETDQVGEIMEKEPTTLEINNIEEIQTEPLKSVHNLHNVSSIVPNENIDTCKNNFNSIEIDNNKLRKQLFQPLDINQDCETVRKKSTSLEVNNIEESQEIQTELNDVLFKPQLMRTLTHSSNNLEENKKETYPSKINEVFSWEHSSPYQETLNTNNNQELHLEKNVTIQTSTISCSNTSYKSSSSSSSSVSIPRTLDKTNNDECEENENNINRLNTLVNNETEEDDDYSPDFTSDENTSELQGFYEPNKHGTTIESQNRDQSSESSYEEERSEGEIMFEDKTFIEQYSDCSDLVQNEKPADEKVDLITDKIFNCLLEDTKKNLNSNMIKPSFCKVKNNLDNLTEETPLLMILKREEEHKNMVLLSDKATVIAKELLQQNLQPIISESLQMCLPKLNEREKEKLSVYLNWSSSKRKKLKLSEYFDSQHKMYDVDNDDSFEIFYEKYQEQKKSTTVNDEGSGVMLRQTQQEAEKLKQEQLRIEEEIERLRMSDEAQFFLREIPNKPPPPYKSPTKIKTFVDMSFSSDEMHKIVLMAASQLFNDSQCSMSKDFITDSDSSLQVDYKTLIFDYCKEIAQDTFTGVESVPIWKRTVKNLKNFRARPKNPKDLSDVILKKMNQIIEVDDCEEKVNKFVVQQMHEEDSKWTDFEMDEMNIENDIVDSLMGKLISDTVINFKTNFSLKFMT